MLGRLKKLVGGPQASAPLVEANPFDSVPVGVLAVILRWAVLAYEPKLSRKELKEEKLEPRGRHEPREGVLRAGRMRRFLPRYLLQLRLVCRAFRRAVETDPVQGTALERCGFGVPERLFYGATLAQVLRGRCRMYSMELRECRGAMAVSSMSRPISANLGKHPHTPDASFVQFVGLLDDERGRLVRNTAALLSFLQEFGTFTPPGTEWAPSTLLRYRMFLHLRVLHPRTLLIPTADIAYAQIAHMLRTEQYSADCDSSAVPPTDVLNLTDSEEPLYRDAVLGTKALWDATFPSGAEFVGPQQLDALMSDDLYKYEKEGFGARTRKKLPPFVRCIGPEPPAAAATIQGLPTVSMEAGDLLNDVKWMDLLRGSFRKVLSDGYMVVGDYPHRPPETVLRHMLQSYQRWLFLVRQHQDRLDVFSPPVHIDMFWHAHILTPELYRVEMARILGYVPEHRPFVGTNDPFPLSQELQALWKDTFGVEVESDFRYV
jgi:hypothetical protein